MAKLEKPGETIRHNKQSIVDAVMAMVDRFEDATDIEIRSIHYYRAEPDRRVLSDRDKHKVDIVLGL